MRIPDRYRIHETEHWLINHRMDSALPGYLMVGATHAAAHELTDLCDAALRSLGSTLAQTQRVMRVLLKPKRIYVARYGHSPCYPIHFHLIPIYPWVEELYRPDTRSGVFAPSTETGSERPADGSELSHFISRRFCSDAAAPTIGGPNVDEAIALLRDAMANKDA